MNLHLPLPLLTVAQSPFNIFLDSFFMLISSHKYPMVLFSQNPGVSSITKIKNPQLKYTHNTGTNLYDKQLYLPLL